jgi:hypothetical protein
MGYDASALLDLEGKGVPDLFLIASVALFTILIADFGFTGFRGSDLGLIVTAFLFIVTLVAYNSLAENPLMGQQNILDGALGFTLGYILLNIGNLLAGIKLSFLSSATSSYLSGILGQGSETVIPIVNIIFAPIGETFLTLAILSGVWLLVRQTRFKDSNPLVLTLILGFVPSALFAVLHGARQPSFLIFAFIINMFWSGIIVYSDKGSIGRKYLPLTVGLVAGLHVGFNASNFGGITKFFGVMVDALGGTYGRSAFAILAFFGLMFAGAAVRMYQILDEEAF